MSCRSVVVLVLATTILGCDGDRAATAEVRGTIYILTGQSGVLFDDERLDADLEAYAPIDRIDFDRSWLLDPSAFQIANVDPKRLLVLRIRQDLEGANVPQGRFMFLVRGEGSFALLCPYMAPVLAKPGVDCD